ncbi:hypothetical protein B0H16DRAFT_1490168 [Mycena metata]|uniref:Uncharacterized protein n=1 Tax=Mycena metata TaxID=1033252 RepID=A0AAD7KIH5_9AGAR|nr:hypothetical protein B0H16DRAFT_1490168 [Mycena metata]
MVKKKWDPDRVASFVQWLATDPSQQTKLGGFEHSMILGYDTDAATDPKRSWSTFTNSGGIYQYLTGHRKQMEKAVAKYREEHRIIRKETWEDLTDEYTPEMQLQLHKFWSESSTGWLFTDCKLFLNDRKIFIETQVESLESQIAGAGGEVIAEPQFADVVLSNTVSFHICPIATVKWLHACTAVRRALPTAFWDPYWPLNGVVLVTNDAKDLDLAGRNGGLAFEYSVALTENFPTALVTHVCGNLVWPAEFKIHRIASVKRFMDGLSL